MGYLGTKPANQVIDSTLIADGTVTTSDIADSAVTGAKLASGAAVANLGFTPISGTGNTTGSSGSVANTGGWSITPSSTKLLFRYNGTTVGSLDSSGNLIVIGNVTAYGTP